METFGIEVEFGGSRAAAVQAIHDAGLGPNREHSYMGHSDTQWIVKSDASVSGGGELVSPPLDFNDPEQRGQVDRAIAALVAAGCRTSNQAGIHVHIGSAGMNARQIAAVARVFTKFEDCIYRLASSGWQTMRPGATSYCPPLSQRQIDGLVKARTEEQVRTAYYGRGEGVYATGHGHGSRYCGLNLHSHFYRQTIEFRVFNSSLNAKRVQSYIALCAAIVRDARNGKLRSVKKAFRLGDMASGVADPKKALFNFLQVLRYEAGMSLEDYQLIKKFWKDSRPQAAISRY